MLYNHEQLRLQKEEQIQNNQFAANVTAAEADIYEHDEHVS